jgi:hypothetical protein
MESISRDLPELSVILVTDTYARVDLAIESWRRQTIADRVELVLVTTGAEDLRSHTNDIVGFQSIQVVQTASIDSLSPARGLGVRHATAPFVFIAETHAYPDADLAATVVKALSGPWSVVVPGFRNANPERRLSRAGFLSDYGAWLQDLPAGKIERTPSYNAAFRRSVLLEFGDRLDHAITFGDELFLGLKARGHQAYFDPAVAIRHVNLCRLGPWIHERFLAGVLIGGYRSARWSWFRRIAYAAGSPLIALVILSRIQGGVREAVRKESMPALTTLAIVLGAFVKAAGEFRGYLAGTGSSADLIMTRYEIRKLSVNAGDGS